jgi:hypothetical protein
MHLRDLTIAELLRMREDAPDVIKKQIDQIIAEKKSRMAQKRIREIALPLYNIPWTK